MFKSCHISNAMQRPGAFPIDSDTCSRVVDKTKSKLLSALLRQATVQFQVQASRSLLRQWTSVADSLHFSTYLSIFSRVCFLILHILHMFERKKEHLETTSPQDTFRASWNSNPEAVLKFFITLWLCQIPSNKKNMFCGWETRAKISFCLMAATDCSLQWVEA